MKRKIVHCIRKLERDGTGHMLNRLILGLDRSHFESHVLCFACDRAFAEGFRKVGVQVECMNGTPTSDRRLVARLGREVKDLRPDIVQGWMHEGNLGVALATVRANSTTRIVWNVRSCLYEQGIGRRFLPKVIRDGTLLSRTPDAIIYPTLMSALHHEEIGFDRGRRVIIPDGFNTSLFQPSEASRIRLRLALGLAPSVRIVGSIKHFNASSSCRLLLQAAAGVVRAAPDVRFVLAGRGVVAENAALSGCIKEEGLAGKVFLLGERRDVASLLPAFDLYCSSSTNEAFPAVVAEAMSSGVPCVVTDVGASKELVDGLGLAVPPGDADGLAAALVAMLALPPDQRVSIGQRGRQRVIERYSVESFVGGYERLYHDILGGATRETRRGWVGGATIPCS